MDPVVEVEYRRDDGDASFLVGLIAGAVIGAALVWVLTAGPERRPFAQQLPLPFGEAPLAAAPISTAEPARAEEPARADDVGSTGGA